MLSNPVFSSVFLQVLDQELQGKYMHHTHVYDDLLLVYPFCKKIIMNMWVPQFQFVAQMHVAKIHVTCVFPSLCASAFHGLSSVTMHIFRGSSYMLHVFLQSFNTFPVTFLFEALMYVVINYQKGGDLKYICSLGGFGNLCQHTCCWTNASI